MDLPPLLPNLKYKELVGHRTPDGNPLPSFDPRSARLIPIVSKAPHGLYISPGVEQAFIGAALTPQATGLLVLDYLYILVRDAGSAIPFFTHFDNLDQFVAASLDPNFFDRPDIAKEKAKWSGAGVFTTLSPIWWQHAYSKPRNPDDPWSSYVDSEANYRTQPYLFSRLHQMARQNRISSLQTDFFHFERMREIVSELEKAGETISVFDMGDELELMYAEQGPERALLALRGLLRVLSPLTHSDSLFVAKSEKKGAEDKGVYFDYVHSTLRELSQKSTAELRQWLTENFLGAKERAHRRALVSYWPEIKLCENLFEGP